jgi:hypothetical protein
MGGLIAIRLQGPGHPPGWLLILAGLAMLVPFVRFEAGQSEPLVDVRLFASRLQWPVQLTAFLSGCRCSGRRSRCRRSPARIPTSPATASARAPASSPR